MESLNKPMGVGKIMDVSFQLYRTHFARLFLLSLLFWGPLYLLTNILLYAVTGAGLFSDTTRLLEDPFPSLNENGEESLDMQQLLIVGVYAIMLIYMLVLTPPALASQFHLVQAAYEQRTLSFGKLLHKSFTRYWPILGNTFLFGLILSAVYSVIIIIIVIVGFAVAFATGVGSSFLESGPESLGEDIVSIVVLVAVYLGFVAVVSAVVSYFVIRLGFYLPAVALEGVSGSLSRSWQLTKRNFWRIFAIWMIIGLIYTVFLLGGYGGLVFLLSFLKSQILMELLYGLFALLLTPLYTIPYAVIYFDLRVRSEGSDLEGLLTKQANGQLVPERTAYADGGASAEHAAHVEQASAAEAAQTNKAPSPDSGAPLSGSNPGRRKNDG